MTILEHDEIIKKYKNQNEVIHGKTISLHPYCTAHIHDVVRLRNQENSMYFLNQGINSTVEYQLTWGEDYFARNNDIYWCVSDKSENIIGTIRLYDIEKDGSCCEIGSFIIDEKYAMVGAYALEVKLLALDFAFDVLKIQRVINKNRSDNKNMNSISKRLGCVFVEDFDLRGVPYKLYELSKDSYSHKRESLLKILDMWVSRK